MAILKNQEIFFAKLNPQRPDKNRIDPTKPNWSVQLRTTDKNVRTQWKELGLNVKAVRVDPADDESAVLHYSVTLRKNAMKEENGKRIHSTPVQVVNGKNQEIDGSSIGNGSIGNIRLYEREYEVAGVKKKAFTLMAIQIVKHIVYTPRPMEEFDETETETILPETASDDSDTADLY